MTYELRCAMTAPVPLARAFDVFENPHNLAKITPPWLGFQVTTPEPVVMRAGAEIEYVIRWLGLPVRWKTLITAYDPPHSFVDEQARGPYTLWRHEHRLEETPRGTVVSDRVTYRLPLGIAGRVAHAIAVKRQLLEIFRFRQRAIAGMLAGMPGAASIQYEDPVITCRT